MRNRITLLAFAALVAMVLMGCKAISGITSFAKCDFDYNSVTDVTICGINSGTKKGITDFGIQDGLKIANAFMNKSFPLSLSINVDVRNPNSSVARLDGFEYILWIDDMRITSGQMTKQISLAASEKTMMPVVLQIDLYELFSKQGKDKIVTLACGLAGKDSAKSRVKLSIKPYFTVGNTMLRYPGYITIGGNRLMPSGD